MTADEQRVKAQERVLKNRVAAQASREKHKQYVHEMETNVNLLTQQNQNLQDQLALALIQITKLKQALSQLKPFFQGPLELIFKHILDKFQVTLH